MAHGPNQFALLKQRRFLPYFGVQTLNAFNDNVYRQSIIALLFWLGVDSNERALYASLAPALFILPFFLFSATAGQIAEKLEKSRLIRFTTAAEVFVMLFAAAGFYWRNLPILLVALFLTGMHSTLFGPVKYSILPSVLKPEELVGGNGLVEMGTSIAVLTGMIVGGLTFSVVHAHGPLIASLTVIALALAGNLCSRFIPPIDAAAPGLAINPNFIAESRAILRLARKDRSVRFSVLGVSWFWFAGTLLTSQLPTYAETNLGGASDSGLLYIFALALFSVGTGIGSILCEKLSARGGQPVEPGLVPLGALGVTVFLIDLYFARSGAAPHAGLSVMQFVHAPGSARIIVDLLGIGLAMGLFIVPLFALIQSRTPKSELSRVIAALNIQNAIFIVAGSLCGLLLHFLHWTVPQMYLALAVANALMGALIFAQVPEFWTRFLRWNRSLLRMR